jgi:hypothetical protein
MNLQSHMAAEPAAAATRHAAQPGKASPTQQAISGVISALEDCYAALRQRWPELPAVVITVFYDRHRSVRGYFWDGQWRSQADPFLPELHIDSTILADPPEAILKTLVHEAVHALAQARGIKDTSREGRYHNQRFAELAQEMGLVAEGDVRIGIRTPRLKQEWLAGPYAPLVQTIGAASRRLWQEDQAAQSRSASNGQAPNGRNSASAAKGRMVKATCRCSPPRIIRAARSTLQGAGIHCSACGNLFSMATAITKEMRT